MRTHSISTATALAVLFSSTVLSVVAAGPASAATATVGSPAGIVVDGVGQRVFVGDDAKDRIIAADYNGKVLDSVSGIEGIFDLALSDDRATLYATARRSHEIVAIDTATLDIKARRRALRSPGRRFRRARSRGVRACGGAGGAHDLPARLGEFLVAEGSVLLLVTAKVIAEKLAPNLPGYGFRHVAGDVVRELAQLRHLIAGERDGDAGR
ncbi:hypothetical protein SCALM49S_09850 [Streptomyces californicus]